VVVKQKCTADHKYMSYKVLSLKWRPQSFKDVVGQDHVTQTLINSFKQKRIAQGYIFTGPRGVGKTTTARIMAMALNAEGGSNSNFNPNDETSKEIAESRSLDVLEIDGASNRGIEEIRGLREQIKFAPMNGLFKIIIIDEVHMLTNQAFNALLRTLEEPPAHGKFIFATTDIHKIPATIISRCQRFDFNRISIKVIVERIKYILEKEKLTYDEESISSIAKKADGSMRDALSLLDQSISYCGDKLTFEKVSAALGLIPHDLFFKYTDAVKLKDNNNMISVLSEFFRHGVAVSDILINLIEHSRNLLYGQINSGSPLTDMNEELIARYIKESSEWDNRDLLRIIQMLSDILGSIRKSETPNIIMEFTSLKLIEMDNSIRIDELISGKINISENEDKNNSQKQNSTSNKKPQKDVKETNGYSSITKNPSDAVEKNNSKDDAIIHKKIINTIDSNDKERTKSNQNNFNQNNYVKPEEKGDTKINKKPLVDEEILAIVKSKWSKIITKVSVEKPSIAAVLEDYIPESCKNSIILLNPLRETGFSMGAMERSMKSIEKILFEIIGVKLSLSFKKNVTNSLSETDKKNIDKQDSDPKDEEVFNKVVDLFDGEILR